MSFDNYPVQGLPMSRCRSDEGCMKIRGVLIEDTFAEAFTMRVARIVITGRSDRAGSARPRSKLTGFATSVIGCKCEAGIERELRAEETPDGRPGVSVLFMTMSKDDLGKRLIERIGQTVLTCPTTACYDGLPDVPDRVGVGSALRFFGDGFQASKVIGGERYWRIPVMEGEFLVQEKFGMVKGRRRRQLSDPRRAAPTALSRRRRPRSMRCTACRASSFRFPAGWYGAGARSASERPRR